jgi:eukaryotic-like serine/threonine-protein kinase
VLGEENPNTLTSIANLALLYPNQRRYAEAEQLYAKVFEVRRRVLGPENPDTTTMASALGQIRLAQQRYVEAETLLRGAWNGQRNKNPEAWQRFETESLLGQSLARQRRFSEAEPLLIAGYQGLWRQKSAIPWDGRHAVEQAAERLAQFYRSSGRPRS